MRRKLNPKRLQDAAALFNAGNASGALAVCKKILKAEAKNVDALNLAGHASARTGDLASAKTYWRKAALLDRSRADLLQNLGTACFQLEEYEGAVEAFAKWVELKPHDMEARYNLGLVQARVGALTEAKTALEAVLAQSPGHLGALANLGSVMLELGQATEALSHYEKALQIKPRDTELLIKYAKILNALFYFDKARAPLAAALKISPNNAAAWSDLANVELNNGDVHAAKECWMKAAHLAPSVANYWKSIGVVEQQLGETQSARAYFHKALKLDPHHGQAFLGLSLMGMTQDENQMALDALQTISGKNSRAECQIRFAIARFLDSQSQAREAFGQFEKANKLKAIELPFDEKEHRALFQMIQEAYWDPASSANSFLPESLNLLTQNERTPVFVLGMPRSGTSLVEQILASHSQVYGAGERAWMSQAMDANVNDPRVASALDWARVREQYLELASKTDGKHPFITDKAPSNFQRIGGIRRAFPNAKIIHCRRDPVDTCLSNFKQLYQIGMNYTYDLHALGIYYNLYVDLMAHWRSLEGDYIHEIDYEVLVSNQEAETRKLLDYVGLPWEDSCLRFHETKREVRTSSVHQVRKPIYKTSIKSWFDYKDQLRPLFDALGQYAPAEVRENAG